MREGSRDVDAPRDCSDALCFLRVGRALHSLSRAAVGLVRAACPRRCQFCLAGDHRCRIARRHDVPMGALLQPLDWAGTSE